MVIRAASSAEAPYNAKRKRPYASFPFQLLAGLVLMILGTLVSIRVSTRLLQSDANSWPTAPQVISNYALAITNRGDYLLTEWPISNLLENDFTIELWYRTELQPENTEKVAILANLRDLEDAEQYGRDFGLYLDGSTGTLVVEFHGYEPVKRDFSNGRLVTSQRIDDGEWHFVRLIRNGQETMGKLTLLVDSVIIGHTVMPTGHDYDSQDQRVVIGGGNGQAFRECQLDNIRIWSQIVKTSPQYSLRGDPQLIMHLSFDDVCDGIYVHDCAWHGNGAIRMGDAMRTTEAFVPVTLPSNSISPSVQCSSWPDTKNNGKKRNQPNEDKTHLITYFAFDCSGEGPWFVKGNLFEIEAYIAPMWLDANRMGMPLLIMTECISAEFRKNFTTPYVTFQEVKDLPSGGTPKNALGEGQFDFQVPNACKTNHGGLAFMKRFLVFEQMFAQGLLTDAVSEYWVHLDLRDSRIRYWPDWRAEAKSQQPQLWLQSVQRKNTWVCGGFQAGTVTGMSHLMRAMTAAIEGNGCAMGGLNDQHLLNRLHSRKEFPNVVIDGGIINSQITRRFDNQTAFAHGHWWMSKKKIRDPYVKSAYPQAVPYYPSQ